MEVRLLVPAVISSCSVKSRRPHSARFPAIYICDSLAIRWRFAGNAVLDSRLAPSFSLADVHLITRPSSSPSPADTHLSTDFP
jgi:hypothetical protein